MAKYRVVFQPSGRRSEVEAGVDLLEAARQVGVAIESSCGGEHTCGECKVLVEEGFFPGERLYSRMTHLSPFATPEAEFISSDERAAGMRLACVAQVRGDVLVTVPAKSRQAVQVVRKEIAVEPLNVKPAVVSYNVQVPLPCLAEPQGDLERLTEALRQTYGLEGLTIDLSALRELPRLLREKDGNVTVDIWSGREILAVRAGPAPDRYGLAVDIGTTTVAAYLAHLAEGRMVASAAIMNPQIACGEDVMSRLTYCKTHEGGLDELHALIVQGVNGLIREVTAGVGLTPEDIADVVVVGNTVMHHLFLRIDPGWLGRSPFVPGCQGPYDLKARDLGLQTQPAAYIHVLPLEAGFVGADNVAALIAQGPHRGDELTLLIDIGTNGEIVLGNKERLLSASCACGPAFEGVHIAHGMRAAEGAIERVRIDPQTYAVNFKVIGEESWRSEGPVATTKVRGICGSGVNDAVAEMFRVGIVTRKGTFNMDIPSPRLRRDAQGVPEFVIAGAEETAIGAEIVISYRDVRAIQLAKAAVYAGIKCLMRRLEVIQPDRVILAGAFGTYINRESALLIGLYPDCDLERVRAVGNAAGHGALLALLDIDKRREAEEVARRVEYVEVAAEENFKRDYIAAMHFPHAEDAFPHVERLLEEARPHSIFPGCAAPSVAHPNL
jgi:uncharacterized 2Fe-2S/4Fe-4S cluster protein (DUF4445 family)